MRRHREGALAKRPAPAVGKTYCRRCSADRSAGSKRLGHNLFAASGNQQKLQPHTIQTQSSRISSNEADMNIQSMTRVTLMSLLLAAGAISGTALAQAPERHD